MTIKEISTRKEMSDKVKSTPLDSPEHWEAIYEMNDIMEEVHRDYINKDAGSRMSAWKCHVSYSLN